MSCLEMLEGKLNDWVYSQCSTTIAEMPFDAQEGGFDDECGGAVEYSGFLPQTTYTLLYA